MKRLLISDAKTFDINNDVYERLLDSVSGTVP